MVRGLVMRINEASISKVSSLPLVLPWDKKERQEAINAKKALFLPNENMDEEKNDIKRESLPQPWLEVDYHIIKCITCEGMMSVVYAYHFILLHQLKNIPN